MAFTRCPTCGEMRFDKKANRCANCGHQIGQFRIKLNQDLIFKHSMAWLKSIVNAIKSYKDNISSRRDYVGDDD